MTAGGVTRVGIGYDAHRLSEGRPLVLGGVVIPFEKGLLGHSDADVLTHAVMDALLGAACLGDIGKFFPDSQAELKGASSLALLKEVSRMLTKEGFKVINADAVIAAQAPKLSPYIEDMRSNISKILNAPVCVKATTEEGMGFTGSGEGMAARAVCLLGSVGNEDL
ncbi:MAG: 2-C-methyl-D-erythritol 2,4-cyclodiphosphate synthase [Clostridiales bacterium]|nr:2-C-methyl-D-erythritol 2,4-cyclodiphosphate synthase [Clostridiales bacterium]